MKLVLLRIAKEDTYYIGKLMAISGASRVFECDVNEYIYAHDSGRYNVTKMYDANDKSIGFKCVKANFSLPIKSQTLEDDKLPDCIYITKKATCVDNEKILFTHACKAILQSLIALVNGDKDLTLDILDIT